MDRDRIGAAPVCSEVQVVWNAGATLGEACLWSEREQALWWVDILQQRVHRFRPADAERRTWNLPDTVSALAERTHAPGLVLAMRNGFAFFDPDTGALQLLAQPGVPGNRFNDGACDAQGRFWSGTMDFACRAPNGGLYRLEPADSAQPRCDLVLDAGFAVTNGPAWSLDGGTMFFNDTVRGQVLALPFDAARGQVGPARLFMQLARHDGYPDGMTVDADGRLWLAHWGAGCVSAHDSTDGHELARVHLPAPHITKMAFGGPGLRTLFITSARHELSEAQLAAYPLSGALFAVDTSVCGLPAPTFRG